MLNNLRKQNKISFLKTLLKSYTNNNLLNPLKISIENNNDKKKQFNFIQKQLFSGAKAKHSLNPNFSHKNTEDVIPKESYIVNLKGKNKLDYIKEKQIKLADDYVCIEMKAAGMGPYDFYFINGHKPLKPNMIHVPGCEGSGIVRKVGSKVCSSYLGKNVAFMVDYNDPNARGSWSEFAYVPESLVMEIDQKKPEFEKAAYCIANPLTALGINLDLLKGRKCIIQDTGNGAMPSMVTKFCVKNGIEIINICIKEEYKKIMINNGSKHNFATDTNTMDELKQLINEFKPSLYLSYTGGIFPSKVFDILLPGTEMCVLGNMSGTNLEGFKTNDLVFEKKWIRGWSIFHFAERYGMRKLLDQLKQSYESGDNTYNTILGKEFKFKDINEAIKYYSLPTREGKPVLKP